MIVAGMALKGRSQLLSSPTFLGPQGPSTRWSKMMEWREIPPNPARLLHAIASIGYDPEVALCDIVDNSVDAGATRVVVQLTAAEEDGDALSSYIIVDDGSGMDETALLNAFKMGSDRAYSERSLGKFGIGLKSAALSLGDRLLLITKVASASKPLCAILSVLSVQDTDRYAVQIGDPPDESLALWSKFAPEKNHGTLVVISGLNDSQPNFSHFVNYIRRYCGITFHMYLADRAKPFTMSVNGQDLLALDPLFTVEADSNGAMVPPSEWSGREVRRLLNATPLDLSASVSATIEATQLVHPPSFETDGTAAEVREHYMIANDEYSGLHRHGFYIYRNRRIIVMAERFRGIVPNDVPSYSFRGRMMFDETADAIVALDVRKRHCQLPRASRTNLKGLIKTYLNTSRNAWKAAGEHETHRKGSVREKIADESLLSGPVTDLKYAPGADLNDSASLAARSEAQVKIEDVSRSSIQDAKLSSEILANLVAGKHPIVMSDGLKSNAMWLPFPAVEAGFARTLVNQHNSWVHAAYDGAERNAALYVVLHQIFAILGRAEIETRSSKWHGMAQDAPDRVLETFRRKASYIAEDLAEPLAEMLKQIADGAFEEGE